MSTPEHFRFTLTKRQVNDLEDSLLVDGDEYANRGIEQPDGTFQFDLGHEDLENLTESLAAACNHAGVVDRNHLCKGVFLCRYPASAAASSRDDEPELLLTAPKVAERCQQCGRYRHPNAILGPLGGDRPCPVLHKCEFGMAVV
jgi:hypothetical protein